MTPENLILAESVMLTSFLSNTLFLQFIYCIDRFLKYLIEFNNANLLKLSFKDLNAADSLALDYPLC